MVLELLDLVSRRGGLGRRRRRRERRVWLVTVPALGLLAAATRPVVLLVLVLPVLRVRLFLVAVMLTVPRIDVRRAKLHLSRVVAS